MNACSSTSENLQIRQKSQTAILNNLTVSNDNVEEDDTIHQIVPISIEDTVLPDQGENTYGKTAQILLNVLGENELIGMFDSTRKKCKKHKDDMDYRDQYLKIIAELEVKVAQSILFLFHVSKLHLSK